LTSKHAIFRVQCYFAGTLPAFPICGYGLSEQSLRRTTPFSAASIYWHASLIAFGYDLEASITPSLTSKHAILRVQCYFAGTLPAFPICGYGLSEQSLRRTTPFSAASIYWHAPLIAFGYDLEASITPSLTSKHAILRVQCYFAGTLPAFPICGHGLSGTTIILTAVEDEILKGCSCGADTF
jgi:hypothetical protein